MHTPIIDTYNLARHELHKLERDRNIKIIYACESGSRAWGFASKNSDWDVRFIYVRPIRSYLGLADRRDVIDQHDLPPRTDKLDLGGWDVKKCLELAAASNPQVVEWLNSPIQYYGYKAFVEELLDIMREFNPRRMAHHYSSMAKKTWEEKLRNVGEKVVYKRYLYALRPLFACLRLEAQPLLVPPVDFKELMREVQFHRRVRPIVEPVNDLLRWKADDNEEAQSNRLPEIDTFINEMVPYTRDAAGAMFDGRSPDMMRLEELSVGMIRQFGNA